jgi:hypothetical protein
MLSATAMNAKQEAYKYACKGSVTLALKPVATASGLSLFVQLAYEHIYFYGSSDHQPYQNLGYQCRCLRAHT